MNQSSARPIIQPVPILAGSTVRLFLTSVVILFVELLVIRWIPANVIYVGYFINFLLMASFLGIGLGILPRAVVIGDSAGGNLALIGAYGLGFDTDVDPLTPPCDVAPTPPAGVISFYPTDDLVGTWEDAKALSDETPFPEIYVGGSPIEYPDRYDAASVQRLIRAGLPTTLLITGDNDQLVKVERIRDLAQTLSFAGSTVELVEVPFADHAFDGASNGFGAQLEDTLLPAFLARVAG